MERLIPAGIRRAYHTGQAAIRTVTDVVNGLANVQEIKKIADKYLSSDPSLKTDFLSLVHCIQQGGDTTKLKTAGLSRFSIILKKVASQQTDPSIVAVINKCIEVIATDGSNNPSAAIGQIQETLSNHPIIIDGVTLPIGLYTGGGSKEDGEKVQSLEEIYQRFVDLPKHPFSIKEVENLDTRGVISTQLKLLEEILTLRGLYSAFTFFGGVSASFEEILQNTESRLKHRLHGCVDLSSAIFKDALIESMETTGKTSWFIKVLLSNIILPAAVGQISSHAKYATKELFSHLDAKVINHRKNGPHPTSATSFPKMMVMIFDKFSYALKNADNRHSDPIDNRTLDQYLSDALNGTTKQREKEYKDLTERFIDAYMFKPLVLGEKLEKTRNALELDMDNPERDPILNSFLKPFYFIALAIIFIFEMIIIKPLEALLNLILVSFVKYFACKINLAQYIFEKGHDVLAGKDGERDTELLDTLFQLILNEANESLLQELNKDFISRETPLYKEISTTERNEVKAFLRSLFKVVNLYENKSSQTLEERAKDLPFGIGEELFEQGLNELAPLLANLYRQITTKKFLEKALATALTALNESFYRRDNFVITNTPKDSLEKARARTSTLNLSLETTGKRLMELLSKTIKEPTDNRMQENSELLRERLLKELQNVQTRMDRALKDIELSTYFNQDKEEKLGVITEWLDGYAKKIIDERLNSITINPHLHERLGYILQKMTKLKSKILNIRMIYAAKIAPASCQKLIDKVLSFDLTSTDFLENLVFDEKHVEQNTKRHVLHMQLLENLFSMKKLKIKENKSNEQESFYNEILLILKKIHVNSSKSDVESLLSKFSKDEFTIIKKILDLPFQTESRKNFQQSLTMLKTEFSSLKANANEKSLKNRKKLEAIHQLSKVDAENYQHTLDLKNEDINLTSFSSTCKKKLRAIQKALTTLEINHPIRYSTGVLDLASSAVSSTKPLLEHLFKNKAKTLIDLLKAPPLLEAILHKILAKTLVPEKQVS